MKWQRGDLSEPNYKNKANKEHWSWHVKLIAAIVHILVTPQTVDRVSTFPEERIAGSS